ncbi:hypothetical protein [Marinicella litoralis]|uniref:SCP domain-containing protein n=1 Tax=Marinicella litoralis TaxID=644220 RepID=A0A4R6XTY7_9GAMM|nr:hypothetical protein [Marinicella litoralis]TDR23445.1 hypothetical protein C8D91_0306 [Marinicella litoralis]
MSQQTKLFFLLILISVSTLLAAAQTQSEFDQICGNNSHAAELGQLIKGHPSQQRQSLQCNAILAEIAQQRAEQLANNSADPEITPNQVIIKGGFRVPNYYPVIGNQVEAVAKNFDQAQHALSYLLESGKHHDHIMGKGDFFALQSQLGVGFFKAQEDTQHDQWVVLIAQPWQSPKIVYQQQFNMPFKIAKGCEKDWQNSNDEFLKRKCSSMGRTKRNSNKETQLDCDEKTCEIQ